MQDKQGWINVTALTTLGHSNNLGEVSPLLTLYAKPSKTSPCLPFNVEVMIPGPQKREFALVYRGPNPQKKE
jgi:hypothetical protein